MPFAELTVELRRMALFTFNTGCRDKEVYRLRWEWEIPIPELNTSVFVIPGKVIKNREDRLVILNDNAKAVIEEVRGMDATYVFVYQGKPYYCMCTTSWRKGRIRAGLPQVRIHDLRHTFGRRLRAAGVNEEDRADLLGHKTRRITTHYSAAEIRNLLDATNKICRKANSTPILTVLKQVNTNMLPFTAKAYMKVEKNHLSTAVPNEAH